MDAGPHRRRRLVDWLVSGKFITIFAALFGIGFAIQMDRATARRRGRRSSIARRMIVLLVIGLAHSFLLWWGDILVTYAICGCFLLFFRHLSQRAILVWAHVTLLVHRRARTSASTSPRSSRAAPTVEPEAKFQEAIDIYARGTFAPDLRARAREWLQVNSFVFFLTRVVGIFLFGLYLWRQGYLAQPDRAPGWWTRAQRYRPDARCSRNRS